MGEEQGRSAKDDEGLAMNPENSAIVKFFRSEKGKEFSKKVRQRDMKGAEAVLKGKKAKTPRRKKRMKGLRDPKEEQLNATQPS